MYVEHYEEFELYQLLVFDPRIGKTTALLALPVEHEITAAVLDAQSQPIVPAVETEEGSNSISRLTAIFDTRTASRHARHARHTRH